MNVEGQESGSEPRGWMRRWAFDGEKPHKEKNARGRWAWPGKFKLKEVTRGKCLPDDVPLYADANQAEITALREALEMIAAYKSGYKFSGTIPAGESPQKDREDMIHLARGVLRTLKREPTKESV